MPIKRKVRTVDPTSIGPRCAGSLWKGEAKATNRAGKSLNEKLRFHGNSRLITQTIANAYNSPAQGFDVTLETLTVFAYSPRLDETFVSYMREWSKKGLIRQCDRSYIQAEMITRTDMHGQTLDVLAKCDKPCPLQDEESFSVACPKGCKQEGIFYFQIPELIAAGVSMPCSLTTHSWLDVTEEGIYGQLQAVQEEFGSIKFAPDNFQLGEFGNKIPLVISRYRQSIKRPMLSSSEKITLGSQQMAKRTGGKADGETYPIAVNVHPAWRRAYLSWKQAQTVQAMGYRPDPKLLQDAGLQFVDAEIVNEPLALPAADDWRKDALDWAIKQGLAVGVADRLITGATDKKACFAALQSEIDKLSTPAITPELVETELEF